MHRRRTRAFVVWLGWLGMGVAIGGVACGSGDDSALPNLLVGGAADAATPFVSAFGAIPDAGFADSGSDAAFVGPPFTNEAGVIFEDAGLLSDTGSDPFVSDSGSNPFVSDTGSDPFVSDSGASPSLGLPFGQ